MGWLAGVAGILVLAAVIVSGCVGSGPGTEVDLTEKNYEQIVALGIPVECEIMNLSGYVDTVGYPKIYIKGRNVRAEVTFGYEGQQFTALNMIKDGEIYMRVFREFFESSLGEFETDCEWIHIDTGDTGLEVSPQVTEEALEKLEAADMECVLGSFGEEKFQTTGKVCSMTEFMQDMYSQILGEI
jgi:hypothetical protein